MLHQPPSYNVLITQPYEHIPQTKRSQLPTIPSILIDFTAMTLCDLIKTRKNRQLRSLPEYVFFVQKVTHQAKINVRTLLVALIYLQRAKAKLPKRAIGNDDTIHRMFLAAVLLASKFLKDTTWTTHTITNRQIYEICGGLFSLDEIHQLERGFLKLLQYDCWVDDESLNDFVKLHRTDFSL
ncbi:MAG: cyclin domain-containing protein [Benjaminiella poitrasii]|nr:MAG: cyclin domain-containing protein [Benjaminiella poitrasii]